MRPKSLFDTGLNYVGLKEVPGIGSNQLILSWIQRFYPQITDDSQCAWCSIFMLVLFKECWYHTQGANPMAKSWANLADSTEIGLLDAQRDDLAIFHRGDPTSWKGHVGVIGNINVEGNIVLLSGNHRNQVTLEAWPTDKLYKIIRPCGDMEGYII